MHLKLSHFISIYNQAVILKKQCFLIRFDFFYVKLLFFLLEQGYILGYCVAGKKLRVYLKYLKENVLLKKFRLFYKKVHPFFHKKEKILPNSFYLTSYGVLPTRKLKV